MRTLFLWLACLSVVATGCREPAGAPGTLVYAGDWLMPPAFHGNPWTPQGVGTVAGFVYEPLFVYLPQTSTFQPRLGTRYAESTDGLTLTVHTHAGVVWHDGEPFTTEDIKTTFAMAALFGDRVWHALDHIECPDATTVVFHWKRYDVSNTLRALTLPISSPRHLYGRFADETDPKRARQEVLAWHPSRPVGTGPFAMQSVSPSDMRLVRFDRHYQAAAMQTREVHLLHWPSNQVVWGYLRSGDVDVATPACPEDVVSELLAHNAHLSVTLIPDRNEFGIGFNCRRAVLSDVRVRQALAHLLDRDQIRQICCSGGLTVDDYSVGLVRSRRDAWLPADFLHGLTRYDHDVEQADRLLTAAGLTQRQGVWCTPEGPWHVEIIAPNVMNDVVLLADAASSQWRKAGIQAEVRVVPFDMYNELIADGHFDVEAGFGALLGKFDDPATSLQYLYASDSPFRTGCGLPQVRGGIDTVQAWNALSTERDARRRQASLQVLCRLANEDLPFVACYEKRILLFLQDGVRLSGWDSKSPLWSAIPGGCETALTTVLLDGTVHPVRKTGLLMRVSPG